MPLDIPGRLVEPANVPEFYVTGIGDVELRDRIIRLALFSEAHGERIIRVRLVMPISARLAMRDQVDEAIAAHEPWH